MDDSLIDNLLDECSQFRLLLVGASRGKAQLIREVFGVNRITRYPPDFSRDEEIYSKENDLFVAHVFDTFEGVEDVVKRRKKGEPDEVIHAIWHYVDAQDAADLVSGSSDLACPNAVLRSGIPVLTVFGRFDNIVTRSKALGAMRRQGQALSEQDEADAAQIRAILEALQLYLLQFPSTTIITSKVPGSKLTLVDTMLARLKYSQTKLLFASAQRLSASLKMDSSLDLAMKQFLVATIGSSVPIPIPFAGYATSTAVIENIKSDIVKIWNLHDPEILLTGTHDNLTLMDTLTSVPAQTAKALIYMIPGLSLIRGVLELPKLASSLGSLMINLSLIFERLFLATMMGADLGKLLATPTRAPSTPIRLEQHNSDRPRALSPEVLRERRQLMSPLQQSISAADLSPSGTKPVPPPKPPRPRPATAAPSTTPAKPARSIDKVETPPARPPRPGQASNAPQTPQPITPALTTTPLKVLMQETRVQPAGSPVTRDLLDSVVLGYEPTRQLVEAEVKDFFDFEEGGLTKSFKKDIVQKKLAEIVSRHRLSKPFA